MSTHSRSTRNMRIPQTGEGAHCLIAVMGATGSGKSTFINRLSGSNLQVGADLNSCTQAVEVSEPFMHERRWVTLVDTPGFDDTGKSDTDVLNLIAAFLESTYRHGTKLAGIIYMHRISDIRMGGTSVRNFKMFRELCGDSSLKNVALATNMWELAPLETCERREAQLRGQFFKNVLEAGGQLVRLYDNFESAQALVQLLVDNHPLPLRIQRELVDEQKTIKETAAGVALMAETEKKLQARIAELEATSEAALEEKDQQFREMLEEEMKRHQDEVTELRKATQSMQERYEAALASQNSFWGQFFDAVTKIASSILPALVMSRAR